MPTRPWLAPKFRRARQAALDRRQTTAFLNAFASEWEYRGGSQIVGTSRNGATFSFHSKHPLGIRRDFLGRILGQIGVSRADFNRWYAKNK